MPKNTALPKSCSEHNNGLACPVCHMAHGASHTDQPTALPKEVTKYKETALFWNNAWEEVGLFETLPEKVQAELYDFEKLISSWSKIAFAITGGKLSYPNYEPDVLVTEYEDFVTEQINEGVQEELTQAHQDTAQASLEHEKGKNAGK